MSGINEIDISSMIKSILKEIVKVIPELADKTIDVVERMNFYCLVHKRATIKCNGIKGWHVWEYLVVNEITFQEYETNKVYSFGIRLTDEEAEELFNELVEKYGTDEDFK